MRHRVQSTRLNRKSAPLKALLRNLASSLVLNGSLQTTEPKAKAVQPLIEKLITAVKKKDEREAIRAAQQVLFQKAATVKLLSEIKPRFANRSSGFTRIIQVGVRKGDSAPLVQLEFTE